ncbi:MAG: DUF1573 domain-containing protein [FCB group bacterium]|nr:DUF1573 domain-containing protein [FCB group bacterium]
MKPLKTFFLIMLTGSVMLPAKNLTLLSKSNLSNFELLDIALFGTRAYIPGGLGGLNIVDLSDPAHPTVLGTFEADNCAWGRLYAWAESGAYAYGTGRECGLKVIDVSNLSAPIEINSYSDPETPNARYEHPAIQGNSLYAARHRDGVEILNISVPGSLTQRAVISTQNAWATLPAGDLLFIADGKQGLKIADISDPNAPFLISSLATSGSVKDLAYRAPYLFLAVGAAGVDLVDVSNPSQPVLLDNYNTTGYASRVAASDSLIAVSDWDDIEILQVDSDTLRLTGIKNTGGRVMAVALSGNTIFSAEWRQFVTMEYGVIDGPDLDFSLRSVEFSRVLPGATDTLEVTVTNSGQAPLLITDLQPNSDNFQLELPTTSLNPGESAPLTVHYSPLNGNWQTVAYLGSNDSDEPNAGLSLRGNYPYGPMPGDPAPDFNLTQVNGNGTVDLQSLYGEPTLIAFFTGW